MKRPDDKQRVLPAATLPLTQLFRFGLAVTLVIISHLATTTLDYPVGSDINDKWEHFTAFLVLAFLTDFAFPNTAWGWKKLLPLLGYGLAIEVFQYFLPHRLFSLWDLGADSLGLICYPLLLPMLKQIPLLAPRWHTGRLLPSKNDIRDPP
ncbi:MAG: VanZ family protein [Chromatiales bacterium]